LNPWILQNLRLALHEVLILALITLGFSLELNVREKNDGGIENKAASSLSEKLQQSSSR
jgi:hypothetical protein